MITDIIEELIEVAPPTANTDDELSPKWESLSNYFAAKIAAFGGAIFSATRPLLGNSISTHSITEGVVTRKPVVTVAEFRLRPATKYYVELGKAVPSPENPNGPHASGLKLSVLLLRSFEARNQIVPAKIVIEFEVWGHIERAGFGEMLTDYRRPIIKLLQNKGYEFFSSVPFDNVDAYKGKDLTRKLLLYYQNENDNESQFTISRELFADNKMSDAVDAVVPLAVLYDCAMGYSQVRKNRDRFLDLMNVIENVK